MLRSTAHLLVVVMLFSSGHLLACGWECLDEVPVAAAASCHQQSAPDTAMNGDGMHACLPATPEPHVTAAKPGAAHALVVAPSARLLIVTGPPPALAGAWLSFQLRFASPHSPAPSVLRI